MLNSLREKLKLNYLFPISILLISGFVAFQNYIPGTWLTGWDNLHPEFDLLLNIKRSIFASWQEYQGLGLLGGMAHAADLPRQLILLLASLVISTQLLRYLWTFLMLGIGPLGVYFLVKRIIQKESNFVNQLAGLVAGLFYLFNLATVQTFYIPFETFINFYGFIPWLLFTAIKYLRQSTKKNLIWFFIVSLLAAPAFYVPTLFVVFLIVLLVFVLEAIVQGGKNAITASKKFLLVLFIANSFWLLPAIYFAISGSDVVDKSKVNSVATVETQLMNQGFGGTEDVALLRGFFFEYTDLGEGNKYDYLFRGWKEHISNPAIQNTGYVLFIVAALGFILNLMRRKSTWSISVFSVFFLSFFMLKSTNPPLGSVFSFFSEKLPLFGQMFRSVFTKWSLVAALSYALGLGLFIAFLGRYLKDKLKIILVLLSTLIILGMVAITGPVFENKLISRRMRPELPEAYLELFDFFKGQNKQARIAFYPVQSFFGWNFHDWGYGGSGFLWYGIEQPILDRAFDVWSASNETFYHELSTAVYGKDQAAVGQVLDKYDVAFVLVDESVFVPQQDKRVLRFTEFKQQLDDIGAESVWNRDFLTVFSLETKQDNFIYSPDQFTFASGEVAYGRSDTIYQSIGDYAEINSSDYQQKQLVFPFSDLTKEQLKGVSYSQVNDKEVISVSRVLEERIKDYQLIIPQIPKGTGYKTLAQIDFTGTNLEISFPEPLLLKLNGHTESLGNLPKLLVKTQRYLNKALVVIEGETLVAERGSKNFAFVDLKVSEPINVMVFDGDNARQIDLAEDFLTQELNQCWTREGMEGLLDRQVTDEVLSIKAQDAAACLSFKLGVLNFSQAMLKVSLPYRSANGARPDFCVVEEGVDECLNKEVFYATPTSKDWAKAERDTILAGSKSYWLTVRGRPPENQEESWTINYQSPEVVSYPIVVGASFTAKNWELLTREKRFAIDKTVSNIAIEFTAEPRKVDFTTSGRLKAYNCDIFDRGFVAKQIDQPSAIYKAGAKATICDYVPLDQVSTNQGHILRFSGEGKVGRGLKFHLFNKKSERDDINVILPEGTFDVSYLMLPWLNLEDKGYVLNIGVRSFGHETSENRLDNIKVYNLPSNWLKSWYLLPDSIDQDKEISFIGESFKFKNQIKISNYKKIATHKYQFKIKVETDPGLIVLSQGFNNGWLAFENNFPWIVGERLSHVKVNSWANGWLVPQGEHELVIIFLPQYLEYFGFGILFGFMLFLFARNGNSGKAGAILKRVDSKLEKAKTKMQQRAKNVWQLKSN